MCLCSNLSVNLCFRDQEALLNDLRVDLAFQFEFLFSSTHVEVISGKQEGVYSWIAINHALGKFDHRMHPGKLEWSSAIL
jgi:GDA1/CD39 (nucleoside phosphatase) family